MNKNRCMVHAHAFKEWSNNYGNIKNVSKLKKCLQDTIQQYPSIIVSYFTKIGNFLISMTTVKVIKNIMYLP